MAVPFHTQLQPFEEHQSPSPTEERENPYELSLSRSLSPKSPKRSNSTRLPTSPVNPPNNLQRQLSGDPDNPPPAWQRRPSVSSIKSKGSSFRSNSRSTRSPSESGNSPVIPPIPSSSARRHPYLTMTATRTPGLPTQLFLHESPNGSSTSLNDDPTLTLPQPAFRRRPGGSSRSSLHSQDLSSLTSEELWALEQDNSPMADMSNPLTRAAERPLDTIRRQSSRIEHSPYRNGLPQDVIWPAAPPPEELYANPSKSRSVTSMASLRNTGNKRMSRRQSRQASQTSIDMANIMSKQVHQKQNPQDILISSNNSSSTSLASHVMPSNKSSATLSRPPSAYYSRDFLSTLAPREGGYAIAAQMGNGLGAVGTMSVEERRRSGVVVESERPRSMARAPMSKSSGMGRWSIDGGENYGRPYTTPSNATTSTSLSMRAGSTNDASPPLEEDASKTSFLPDGAQPPARSTTEVIPLPAPNTIPINPSPLSQNTAEDDLPKPRATEPSTPPIPTTEAATAAPTPAPLAQLPVPAAPASAATTAAATPHPPTPLNTKKSKKDLAKDAKASAKAAEKAAAAKAAADKAKAARDAALKKQADKDAAKKKKEDDKRKAKEDKERQKAAKKAEKQKSKTVAKGSAAKSVVAATPASKAAPPATPATNVQNATATPAKPSPIPLPRTTSEQTGVTPVRDGSRPAAVSMPINSLSTNTSKTSAPPAESPSKGTARRTGIFGTLRKRMSIFGDLRESDGSRSAKSPSPKPPVPGSLTQPSTDFGPAPPPAAPTSAGPPIDNHLQRVQTPPQNSAVIGSTLEPLSHLPPRSSSHTPVANHLASHRSSPESHRSASMSGPMASKLPGSYVSPDRTVSVLDKTRTNNPHSRETSPSSNRRNVSLRGPRPMPRQSNSPTPERDVRDRSDSMRSHNASQTMSTSYPSNTFNLTTGENIPSSTSGDSAENDSSIYSQSESKSSATGGDFASPFTSDGEPPLVDSCKGSLAEPEREGSSETVHPVAPVGIPAGHTVAAH